MQIRPFKTYLLGDLPAYGGKRKTKRTSGSKLVKKKRKGNNLRCRKPFPWIGGVMFKDVRGLLQAVFTSTAYQPLCLRKPDKAFYRQCLIAFYLVQYYSPLCTPCKYDIHRYLQSDKDIPRYHSFIFTPFFLKLQKEKATTLDVRALSLSGGGLFLIPLK